MRCRCPGFPYSYRFLPARAPFSGTVVQFTDATGLATFNDLKIGTVGIMKLRAVSQQQAPVDSNTFQITAGAPASIAVFSGSPQATTVSNQFPSLLQARVTDIAGNPVSGVSVTFALPAATGPSGTFSGPTTVATDANGGATAPLLTANSSPGNFVVTATAAGVSSPAVFALTNLPQQSSATIVTPSDSLTFLSEINQAARPDKVANRGQRHIDLVRFLLGLVAHCSARQRNRQWADHGKRQTGRTLGRQLLGFHPRDGFLGPAYIWYW